MVMMWQVYVNRRISIPLLRVEATTYVTNADEDTE